MVDILIYVFLCILAIGGIILTLLSFPGVWLIYIAIVILAFLGDFLIITPVILIILFFLSLLSTFIDNIHLLPLYSFFKICDVHVTERSSTIIEAANFGIKSIVTSKYSLEIFEEYFDSGMVVYGSSWKEVIKYIKRFKKEDNIKKRKEVDILELIKMIEEI